jgi:protein-disulfide isomerase
MARLRDPIRPDDHVLGEPDARVVLVEYGDYECPHCAAAQPHVAAVLQRFGADICYVFRHFPLTQIHPNAATAAESAEYAGAHDRFWEMHDGIYQNQSALGLPMLFALVRQLGLSEQGLRDALTRGTFAVKVEDDFRGGVRSGVNGTPTFFINGQRHDGMSTFEDLAAAIAARLAYLPAG